MLLRTLGLSIVLAGIWMLLSGFFEPLLLGLGAVSVALCVYIAHRMEVVDHEGLPIHIGASALLYWPWLWLEIAKSTWDTILVILFPAGRLKPVCFDASASQLDELGQTTYANSIILTPGTVTLEIKDSVFLIHALNDSFKEGVTNGLMDAKVTRMMGETPPAPPVPTPPQKPEGAAS